MKCPMCSWDTAAEVVWSLELELPLQWLSANVIKANVLGHGGWKYRAYRQKLEASIRRLAGKIAPASRWRRAYLVRRYAKGCRHFDFDDLCYGGKPMVDAMVATGLLVDDSPKWFLAAYAQEKAPNGKHSIKIRLEEVAGDSAQA